MMKILRFWKVIIIDTLGVVLIVVSPFTGLLPGPGGIPVFLIGLSLLAINHDWAQRYIDIVKERVGSLGDVIFRDDPRLKWFYDVVTPGLLLLGVWYLLRHSALWMISAGIFCLFTGLTLFLGNRQRWKNFKARLKAKAK